MVFSTHLIAKLGKPNYATHSAEMTLHFHSQHVHRVKTVKYVGIILGYNFKKKLDSYAV